MANMYNRPKQKRHLERKIVFASEGKESEPNYLTGVRAEAGLRKEQLILAGSGMMPLTAVQHAIQKRQDLIRDYAYSEADGDTTWATFDGEEHRDNPAKLQNWNEALSLAEREGIRIVNSEPCVELWFLLHVQDQNAHLDRVNANRELKRHFPDYDKGDRDFFRKLRNAGDENAAKQRAKDLRVMHDRNGNDPNLSNPSSKMDTLVEAIQALSLPPKSIPNRNTIRTLLLGSRERLNELNVARLTLYGAFSRGDANYGHQINLVVEFTEERHRAKFSAVKSLLNNILDHSVDLVAPESIREPEKFENDKFEIF